MPSRAGDDAALAGDDLADAALRRADFLDQPVLDDAQRLEEFFQQDFAWGGERDLTREPQSQTRYCFIQGRGSIHVQRK